VRGSVPTKRQLAFPGGEPFGTRLSLLQSTIINFEGDIEASLSLGDDVLTFPFYLE